MQTIQLTRGVPADESYPLELVRECAAAVMQDPKLALEAMRYGTGYGFTPLRELLATQNGVSPDQVLIGNGSLSFVDLLGLIQPVRLHLWAESNQVNPQTINCHCQSALGRG